MAAPWSPAPPGAIGDAYRLPAGRSPRAAGNGGAGRGGATRRGGGAAGAYPCKADYALTKGGHPLRRHFRAGLPGVRTQLTQAGPEGGSGGGPAEEGNPLLHDFPGSGIIWEKGGKVMRYRGIMARKCRLTLSLRPDEVELLGALWRALGCPYDSLSRWAAYTLLDLSTTSQLLAGSPLLHQWAAVEAVAGVRG